MTINQHHSSSRIAFDASKFASYFFYMAASLQTKQLLPSMANLETKPHLFEQESFIRQLDELIQRLNLTLHVEGTLNLDEGALVVANHISWVDALLLAKLAPFSFIAKQEVRSWPIVGRIAKQCQVQFIDRLNKFSVYRQLPTIEQALRSKHHVILFPEGTTTNGTNTEPFYPMLFETAVRTQARIQPIVIRYMSPHGDHLPDVAFIDDDVLIETILRMLKHTTIEAHLDILPPFLPGTLDRKQCALKARKMINTVLCQQPT